MRPGGLSLSLGAICALLAGVARAASFEVSPVVIALTPGQTTVAVEVRNRGLKPLAIQARPYDWSQDGDKDALTSADDVIISPPIFTIPSGETQVIRLLLRGGPRARERDYRLLIDEVPTAHEGAGVRAIAIRLEMSLPIFAPPTKGGAAALTWRLQPNVDGETLVAATNTGARYARVNLLELLTPDGRRQRLWPEGATPYVLPGATRRWVLQDRSGRGRTGDAHAPVHLSVTTQSGKTELSLTPPL